MPPERKSGALLLRNAPAQTPSLAREFAGDENRRMKALAVILIAVAVAFAAFHFYFQKMPTTDEGTAPTQAISLTGVRMDLLQIAQAERSYIALNSRCASLDELVSSSALSVPRSGRDGYAYSVECSAGAEFKVTARHEPAPPSSPIRYPNLAVDTNMQVSEIN